MVCPVNSVLSYKRFWYRKSDKKYINNGDLNRFWIINEFLIINRLLFTDEQIYVCLVNNSMGEDVQEIQLTITCKFFIIDHFNSSIFQYPTSFTSLLKC